MLRLLRDLFRHEAWADKEHLKAMEANLSLAEDGEIKERLKHLHWVQRFFLGFCGGEKLRVDVALDSAADFRRAIEEYHAAMARLLEGLNDERLGEVVTFPKPLDFCSTVREALVQAVTHSQHHRGQNARRMRELGVAPPMTDYILWVRQGRP